MKKGIHTGKIPHVPPVALWIAFTALCGLGCLTTLIDLNRLPAREQARAATLRQHLLIDPVSGEVMLTIAPKDEKGAPTETFDVAETPKEPTAEAHDEHPAEPEASHAKHTENTSEVTQETTAESETTKAPIGEPSTEKPEETHAEPTPAATPTAEETATPTHPPEAAASHEAPVTADAAAVAAATRTMPTLRTTPTVTRLEEVPTRTADSLVPAPAREVSETVGELTLPKRTNKEVYPAAFYARPFKAKATQIPISFIITDVGLDPQSIGGVLSLPPQISAAYSPYVKPETSYSESLRAAGHEVWLMLPTMTDRYPNEDPGPLGIIAQMPGEEAIRRVHTMLALVPGSVGFVLPANEAMGARKGALEGIIHELYTRGLYLLSGNPQRAPDQLTSQKAHRFSLARADLVLDPEPNETQIQSKLNGITEAAKEKGRYLVLVSSRPQSLQLLGEWLKQHPLPEPFVLAPASALYRAAPVAAEAAPQAEGEKPEGGEHGGGHGSGEKKEKEKKKPKEKPKKPLPQDKYLKPADEKKDGGHGGGGGH